MTAGLRSEELNSHHISLDNARVQSSQTLIVCWIGDIILAELKCKVIFKPN